MEQRMKAEYGAEEKLIRTVIAPADAASLAQAAELIRSGQLVGFPTETVYGLGADALNPTAVAKIFAAKGRPADNPLIAHVSSWQLAEELARFTPLARKLAAAFWPGPLTLVVPRRPLVPDIVTAGLETVGLRWPSHPVAAALITAAGRPLAAPSGNLSGRPSPTLARHMLEDLAGRVPLILDGGPVEIGLESTVVDASGEIPVLLRPGRVTLEQLRELCGQVGLPGRGASQRPAAPGMKYRHYAPQGQLYLASDYRAVEALRQRLLADGGPPPLLLLGESSIPRLLDLGVAREQIISLGATEEEMANRLFAALREADRRQAGRIIAEEAADSGLGRAIMNRLNKAASPCPEEDQGADAGPVPEAVR